MVERVQLRSPKRTVTFYATLSEDTQKGNILPSTDVEGGFSVSQFSSKKPRTGTLTIILLDPDTLPGGSNPLGTGQSKNAQKEALDLIFDLYKEGGTATLISEMESVSEIAIEDIVYRRDRATNKYDANVQWREIRTAKTAEVTVERIGKLDPSTNTFSDAPPHDQGFVISLKEEVE